MQSLIGKLQPVPPKQVLLREQFISASADYDAAAIHDEHSLAQITYQVQIVCRGGQHRQ